MGLGLLLIPAVGGYYFISNFHKTRHYIDQISNYHIVLMSAFAGIILLIVARIITWGILSHIPYYNHIYEIWNRIVPFNYSGTIFVSFILGCCLPYILNHFIDTEKELKRALRREGNLIGLVAYQAMEKEIPLALTLKSGKVYIGDPLELSPIRKDRSDIFIIPFASGHRDQHTGILNVDIIYAHVLKEVIEKNDAFSHLYYDDFRVAIPIVEIESARLFDWDVYKYVTNTEAN